MDELDSGSAIGVGVSPQAEIWPFRKKRTKEIIPLDPLEPLNDDNQEPTTVIHPLKHVEYIDGNKVVDIDSDLDKMFLDLASQRTIESETQRTQYIQELMDKASEKYGVSTKVYILKRGLDPNAFAAADGSIFLTQALIDNLKSVDELVAILGHELGHIVFNAFNNKVTSHDPNGTGWLHESASDSLAPQILEDLGLNSTALQDAIKRISSSSRDYAHQTGLMRATESVGMHSGIDYTTSAKSHTPIPDFVKGEKAAKTNIEIVADAFKRKDFDFVEKSFEQLHPHDLLEAFRIAQTAPGRFAYYNEKKGTFKLPDEYYNIITSFHDHFRGKLAEKGFEKGEINKFLFLMSSTYEITNFSQINSQEDLISVFTDISEYIVSPKKKDMFHALFEMEGSRTNLDEFFRELIGNYYNPQKGNNKYQIPLTPDNMVDVAGCVYDQKNPVHDVISTLSFQITTYIDKEFGIFTGKTVIPEIKDSFYGTDDVKILRLDREGARDFLTKIKTRGIELEFSRSYFELDDSDPNFEYYNEIRTLIKEILGYEEREDKAIVDLEEETNKFFDTFCKENPFDKRMGSASGFIASLEYYCEDLPEAERVEILKKIFARLDEVDFSDDALPNEANKTFYQEDPRLLLEQNKSNARRYAIKEALILKIFEKDSDDFYSLLTETMESSGIDYEKLDLNGSLELARNLILVDEKDMALLYTVMTRGVLSRYNDIKIEDFARYCELPHIKRIIEREQESFSSLSELNTALADIRKSDVFVRDSKLYDDSLLAIITGKGFRDSFEKIIESNLENEDPSELASFISTNFPNSPRTTNILRLLDHNILNSNSSLEYKIQYLDRQFDRIGPGGMVLVAEEIADLDSYRYFREVMGKRLEGYLSGSKVISQLAAADNATSELSMASHHIFGSSKNDEASSKESSTLLAQIWADAWLGNGARHNSVKYNPDSGQFDVDSRGRQVFRSFADTVGRLQQMSESQRMATAVKGLVDQYGSLTSDSGRRSFGRNVIESVGVTDEFVKKAIAIGLEKAPPEYIALPAAKMIAPLLFRSLDVNSIDYSKVRGQLHITRDDKEPKIESRELVRLLSSTTRDITNFGGNKTLDPTSRIAQLVFDADDSFTYANDTLEEKLATEDNNANIEESRNPSSSESIISAVEASGALGVRSLQLARQLYKFSPEVDARLAHSFDQNKGLNKLLFWENLNKIAGQDGNGAADFIENNIVSVGDYLGGGSLYTTFAARIRTPEGEEKDVVVKMLNPNPELFIETSYKTSIDTLDEIASQKGDTASIASLGKVFVEMSREWCLADINDREFEKDDDDFIRTVESYNNKTGTNTFFVPERHLTTYRIKSEEKAAGRTLNKVLSDPEVPASTKQQLVTDVRKLFEFQLNEVARVDGDEQTHLVHSDPHIGNYVVDINGETPKIGVIDRSMYLKLNKKQAEIFSTLLTTGDYRHFIEPFIDEVMDVNKLENQGQRDAKKASIVSGMRREYVTQRLSAFIKRQPTDNLPLLRKFMAEIDGAGLFIPLELRLMIRNVESLRELDKRYSTDA